MKFYSSCRIDVRRIGPVKEGEEITGSRIKVKVVKNKVAPPFRVCEFDMMYSGGISREGDLMDLAMADKIVEKSGSWFNYGDLRLGQGRENAKQYLRDNPAVADEITAKIMATRGGPASTAPAAPNGERRGRGIEPEPASPLPDPDRRRTRDRDPGLGSVPVVQDDPRHRPVERDPDERDRVARDERRARAGSGGSVFQVSSQWRLSTAEPVAGSGATSASSTRLASNDVTRPEPSRK